MRLCNFYANKMHSLSEMQKDKRQETILELITERQICKQEELSELLESKGFIVNQSSVSRDLVELGIIKTHGFYAIPQKTNYASFGLISLEIAGESLIVAKTEIGFAGAVCVKVDNAKIAEIVGTIAGEDTIFIAVRNQKEQRLVLKKVWELFEN
jgi:transcriptional regulator of arginine metabolism